jgi:hypothetical protein
MNRIAQAAVEYTRLFTNVRPVYDLDAQGTWDFESYKEKKRVVAAQIRFEVKPPPDAPAIAAAATADGTTAGAPTFITDGSGKDTTAVSAVAGAVAQAEDSGHNGEDDGGRDEEGFSLKHLAEEALMRASNSANLLVKDFDRDVRQFQVCVSVCVCVCCV